MSKFRIIEVQYFLTTTSATANEDDNNNNNNNNNSDDNNKYIIYHLVMHLTPIYEKSGCKWLIQGKYIITK